MAFKLGILALLLLQTASLVAAVPPNLDIRPNPAPRLETTVIFPQYWPNRWDLRNDEEAQIEFRITNQENTPIDLNYIHGTIGVTYSSTRDSEEPIDPHNYDSSIDAHESQTFNYKFTPSFTHTRVPGTFNITFLARVSQGGHYWNVNLYKTEELII